MRISDWSSDVCSSDLFKSELEPSFIAIGANGRLNLNASWEHQTMLRESDRDQTYDDANRAAEAPARSLSPASEQYVIESTIVRNLDKVTDVQASLRFDQTDSLALLGLGADGVGPALRRQSRKIGRASCRERVCQYV